MQAKRRAMRCPGCGLLIVFDDAVCKIYHPNPHCAAFQTICRVSGMKPQHEPWAFVVAPDGRVKTPGDA